MRVSDGQLGELRSRGWVVVPNFLEPEELREAQEGLWESGLQRPEAFFDPSNAEERAKFRNGPSFFADSFPFRSLALNKLLLHPNLIDACERFLGGSVRLTVGTPGALLAARSGNWLPMNRRCLAWRSRPSIQSKDILS